MIDGINVQNNPINFIDPLGLYLTPTQQLQVSLISGAGSAVGCIWGPAGGAVGGALAGAIATKQLEGSTWRDVANNAISGALSGATGAEIANLLKGTMHAYKAAAATGVISGLLDAALLGSDPLIKEPVPTVEQNSQCK